jgi:diguanylate cyclase (GGDEF)-like protein
MLSELNTEKAKSTSQAEVVAENIRTRLAETYLLNIKREGQAGSIVEHRCSASIGVVVFMDHEANPDDILKWADQAMYQAKEAGRNAIRFYKTNVRP